MENGNAEKALQRAIVLSVSFGKPGVRRKVDSSEVEIDADKSLIHVSKEILSCDEYRAVGKLDSLLTKTLREKCLPANKFFRRGFHLVSPEMLSEVDQTVMDFKTSRILFKDAFLRIYPTLVEQDKARLRGTYDAADYPPFEEVDRAFYLRSRYLTLTTPDNLRGANAEIFARQEQENAQFWAEAREEVRSTLRVAMSEFVNHLLDKLIGAGGEKPKIFRDTAVTKLTAFLDTFERRNIGDDGDMLVLVQQARALMAGVDPQTVRENGTVRETVTQSLEKIKGSLDGLLATRTRQIKLPD